MNANIIASTLMLFVLVIFTIFLFHRGTKRYSNIMLIIYFISQILVVGNNAIFFFSLNHYLIVFPIKYTWGPCFFLYFSSLVNPSFKLGPKHTIHFIPAAGIFFYLLFAYYTKDFSSRHGLLESDEFLAIIFKQFNYIFNAQIIGYNIASVILYYFQQRKLKKEDMTGQNKRFAFWVKLSVFGFLISCSVTQISIFFRNSDMFTTVNWFFISNITFVIFFTLLFYVAILYPDAIVQVREKNRNISESEAKKIISILDEYMMTKTPYKKSNLSLKELALETGINERTLSNVINDYKKQNFFDYINSFRVEHAMGLLSEPENYNRTMFDILFDCGFNSKTTFNTAFKKYTGITPSDFRKNQAFGLLANQCA
jgi:AraC-like DNA-binding protein